MTYADRYPEQVAGMVLLDSTSPDQFTAIPSYPVQYALMRRGLALLPTLARLGLGPAISPASHLPDRRRRPGQRHAARPRKRSATVATSCR